MTSRQMYKDRVAKGRESHLWKEWDALQQTCVRVPTLLAALRVVWLSHMGVGFERRLSPI
jgi:hypothetical protein